LCTVILLSCPGGEEDMNVEGLACYVVGARQVCVVVIFTDNHPECRNGMPVALVQGCTVARDQAELARLALRPGGLCPDPPDVRLYVEPDTTDAEICLLWLAGFRVRVVKVSEVFSVPGWWHLAAHRHHQAETRGVRCPPSSREGREPGPGARPDVTTGPAPRCPGP
jgi:hypothetical protein